MEIRKFDGEDESAVIALWTEVLPPNAPHNDPSRAIRQKVAFDPDLFFVALVDGVVGGTVMGGFDGHRGWIYSVAVLPAFRKQGIGTKLILHVEAALADLGCLKINLQVRTTNKSVIAFYRKLGYSVDDVISLGKRLY